MDDRRSVAELKAALDDPDAQVRRGAVLALFAAFQSGTAFKARDALMRLRDPAMIPLFVDALRNERPPLTDMAADWLIQLRSAEARPQVEALLADGNVLVRATARDALAKLPGPGRLDLLAAGLMDTDRSARWRTTRSIWDVARSAPLEELAALAGHENATVRGVAARYLGRLHGHDALPALRGLLGDPDLKVRWWAQVALEEAAQPRLQDLPLDGHVGFAPPPG